ncbi:MAG: hypothetical protein ACI8UD_000214 [Planctomycetota bacterium]|jgi:hypothetical protein
MNEWRRSSFGNPAAWYTAIGCCLLGLSLAIPWLSASRTTRVETRADDIANAMLEASQGFVPPFDSSDVQCLLARFYQVAACRGVRVNQVVQVEPALEGCVLCLKNKHYAFQLSESPLDATSRAGRDTVASVEVMAWPLSAVGPGHCVFFYPEGTTRAYSRNLRRSYAGLELDDRPAPGAAHRRPGHGSLKRSQYPGNDNERWIIY